MRLVKNTVLLSLGLYLLFLAIFFARNTYIPASGYAPAVLLDHQGDPISLRKKEKPIVILSGWGTPEVLIRPMMITYFGELQEEKE